MYKLWYSRNKHACVQVLDSMKTLTPETQKELDL